MNINDLPKSTLSLLSKFPEDCKHKLLKLAIVAHQRVQDHSHIIDRLSRDTSTPKEQILEVLGVYIGLVQLFLQYNDAEFISRLTEIGFPQEFIEKLPLVGCRNEIVTTLANNNDTDFSKISLLSWKINVSLSDSTVLKKIPTPIILCFKMKNGDRYTIEVDAKIFPKLRFNIALVLKELNMLKSS